MHLADNVLVTSLVAASGWAGLGWAVVLHSASYIGNNAKYDILNVT